MRHVPSNIREWRNLSPIDANKWRRVAISPRICASALQAARDLAQITLFRGMDAAICHDLLLGERFEKKKGGHHFSRGPRVRRRLDNGKIEASPGAGSHRRVGTHVITLPEAKFSRARTTTNADLEDGENFLNVVPQRVNASLHHLLIQSK
ncbi:hypothetical protein KM043_016455 [Ampulex compressa]|nr:hypothetical protein KM043_016455 [Ampulex compressa]